MVVVGLLVVYESGCGVGFSGCDCVVVVSVIVLLERELPAA